MAALPRLRRQWNQAFFQRVEVDHSEGGSALEMTTLFGSNESRLVGWLATDRTPFTRIAMVLQPDSSHAVASEFLPHICGRNKLERPRSPTTGELFGAAKARLQREEDAMRFNIPPWPSNRLWKWR
jgi:hypothetical protein